MSRKRITAHREVAELILHTAARYTANARLAGGPYTHLSTVFSALADAVSGPSPAAQMRAVGEGLTDHPALAEIVGDLANLLEAR